MSRIASRLRMVAAVCLFSGIFSSKVISETFVVDVSGDEFTLYTDPNTGGQVKVGGLSALAPVPHDRSGRLFYTLSDRGATVDFEEATDITRLEDAAGRLLADPAKTIEQLTPDELSAMGIVPALTVEVLSSLSALDPDLANVEGVVISGKNLVFTADNDFNLDEAGDFSTNPATLPFFDPPLQSKLVTTPLPRIKFPGDGDDDE